MNDNTTSQSDLIRTSRVEIREVYGFDRVSLRVQNIQNDLVIRQGERESLVIEASPDLLSRVKTGVRDGELTIRIAGSWSDLIKEALATSLTRQRIRYTLTVRQLTALEIVGLAQVETGNLETDRLALRFNGPGKARFSSLYTRSLAVELSGPCKVEMAGAVLEQRLDINAISFYHAPHLKSKTAVVRLNGPGQATIWVQDSLEAVISGPGRLEYYGTPQVRQKSMPFGGLVNLGDP